MRSRVFFASIRCLCRFFFFSSRRRHTRSLCDWSSDVCSSDLLWGAGADLWGRRRTLLVAMFLSAVLLLGYLGGATFLFFLAWGLLYTFLSNPVGTLIDSLVLDYLEGRPAAVFGQLRMWGAAGWAVAALLVGYAITGRDIRLIFIFGALLMLIGWLLVWRRTSETSGDRAFGQTWM